MKNIVVAPVGKNMESLFVGIREFPTEKVILITPKNRIDEANKAKEELERFKIPTELKQIDGDIWEGTFKAVAEIKSIEKNHEIIINTAI